MKTILVVDDSALIRKAISRIIQPMGFEVHEAGDGCQALEYFEAGGSPDAILLDVEMPNMDGISFLKTLRSREDLAQPPVVMCTTRNEIAIITEAIQSGASEYVMKPFDESILGAKLEGIGLVA
jgi:two-component system, chemotaxis family, chemotaxis protein CheY